LLVLGVSLVDKNEHELVPLHELLSEADAEKALKEIGIKSDKLPRILEDDPQAKKLNAKSGQIIKIYRNDAGNSYILYRLVVKG
jgi:DNA-directed RNA polymerase subunit H (RpoH/RPB5)